MRFTAVTPTVKAFTAIVIVLLVLVKLYQMGSVSPVQPPLIVAQPLGAKSVVTKIMYVSTDFYAIGGVWCFQNAQCQHMGIDYDAEHGSAVFMPFDCIFTMIGHYDDPARMGDYFICHLTQDGFEYYSGHLENVRSFALGQIIPAGTLIGFTNQYDHTHIQLRDTSGTLLDFSLYYATH